MRHFRLQFRFIIVFGLQRFCAGVVFALALASQCVSRGSCMDPSFDPVIRYHIAWQPVEVHNNIDLVRWDNWSTLRVIPTICWQLGGLEQNLVVYAFLDLISISHLRVACFGWAVELSDNQEEYIILRRARARRLQVQIVELEVCTVRIAMFQVDSRFG